MISQTEAILGMRQIELTVCPLSDFWEKGIGIEALPDETMNIGEAAIG